MAAVYLVVAEGPSGFNKLQVLKMMRSDLPHDEQGDFLRMFEDEARLAARLGAAGADRRSGAGRLERRGRAPGLPPPRLGGERCGDRAGGA